MLVWGQPRKAPDMKGKRYSTEDKIRILREASSGNQRGRDLKLENRNRG
jgi:hypothetical protein